nr:immunoglobulin light chain junction region [Mus musculus]
CQQNNEDPWTF